MILFIQKMILNQKIRRFKSLSHPEIVLQSQKVDKLILKHINKRTNAKGMML